MKQRLTLSVLISVVALAAIVWFLMSSGAEPSYSTASLDPEAGATDLDDRASFSASDPASAESVALEPAGETAADEPGTQGDDATLEGPFLHGRVTDLSGRGLEGARVVIASDGGGIFGGGGGGAFGRGGFFGGGGEDDEDAERRALLRARAVGRLPAQTDGVVLRTLTAADGRYRFSIPAIPPGSYRVVAALDGFEPRGESWTWSEETERLDFSLGLGDWIAGTVVGLEGDPVVGAVVEAREEEDGGRGFRGIFGSRPLVDETTTDAYGRFRLSVGSGSFAITARAPGHAAAESRRVPPGTLDLVVGLPPGRSLAAIVRDAAGRPIPGAEVTLFEESFFSSGRFEGRRGGFVSRLSSNTFRRRLLGAAEAVGETDERGELRFTDLDAGRFAVVVEKPGYRTEQARADLSDDDAPPRETAVSKTSRVTSSETASPDAPTSRVELTLDAGRVLAGRVVDESGSPVEGAFVVVAAGGDEPWGRGRRGRGGREERIEELRAEGRLEEAQRFEEAMRRREEERSRRPLALFFASGATETDAAGSFRFDTLAETTYTLSVESDGFVPRRDDEGIDLSNEDREVEVVLDRGVIVEGRVLSSAGDRPVAGARISMRRREQSRSLESDEEGRFEIGGLAPGDSWNLVVDASGYTMTFVDDFEVEPSPRVQELDVRLDPAATVTGRVVDHSGTPVPLATVRIEEAPMPDDDDDEVEDEDRERRRREDFRRRFERFREERRRRVLAVEAETDGDGRFTLRDVNPADAVRLRVRHPDYLEHTGEPFSVRPGEEVEGLIVRLRAGGRLLVSVRDPDGGEVSGASVWIARWDEESAAGREEGEEDRGRFGRGRGRRGRSPFRDGLRRRSDAAGDVVFSGLRGGVYAVWSEERGFQPFTATTDISEGRVSELRMQLLPENTIAGIVVDTLGQPVEGARLRARPSGETSGPSVPRGESWARSDDDGTFRLGSLGGGPYELRVERRGYTERRVEDVPVNVSRTITLERLGSVSGWALSADTGLPVTRYEVRLRLRDDEDDEEAAGGDSSADERRRRFRGRRGGGRRLGQRVDNPEGLFTIDDVPPGDYTLEATARGFTGSAVRVSVAEGQAVEGVELRLLEGLSIAGNVVDAGTRRPVEGASIYLVADRPSQDDRREDDERRGRTRRGEDGEEGERRRAEFRGRAERSRGGAEAAVGDLQASALFHSVSRGGERRSEVASDALGAFRLEELAPGRYTLIVHHDDYVPHAETVEVRDDRAPPQGEIALETGAEVRGRVTAGGRDPVSGATLVFELPERIEKRVVTDERGRFLATGFVPGAYAVRIALPGEAPRAGPTLTIKKGRNEFDHDVEE